MHQYKTIDLSYFETAPILLDVDIEIDCPADKIWPIFESNKAWEEFTSGIKNATWTSEPPLRPGSTRHVQLSGMIGNGVVNEVFFDWQPGLQFAFYMKDGSSGMIDAYGELWSLEDLGNGKTRLRMRTAMELKGKFAEWFARRLRRVLNWGYSFDLKSVKKYVHDHVGSAT